MADLTGAVTVLGTSGTPTAPADQYDARTGDSGARTYTVPFTELGAAGVPGPEQGPFTGRSASTSDGKMVTDTYIAVLTFGPVDAVDLDLMDVYVPVLGMSASVSATRTGADVYRPVLNMAVPSLVKSGTFPKAGTDSYVPVLTMTVATRVEITGADSYVPVLTMAATSVASSDEVVLTDTYVPVLDFGLSLEQVNATAAKSVTDTYRVALGMVGGVNLTSDVDSITFVARPFGYIELVRV